MGKQSRNQRRRYVLRQSSGIGLLWTRPENYAERLWQRTYDAAVKAGKTTEQAAKLADNEVRTVKAKA